VDGGLEHPGLRTWRWACATTPTSASNFCTRSSASSEHLGELTVLFGLRVSFVADDAGADRVDASIQGLASGSSAARPPS